MISLHHVADLAPVYGRIARSLRPGGRLVNADGLRAADDALHDAHMARWHAFWRVPGNRSPAEQTEVADHVAAHDHYQTLADHFAWLRAAGLRVSGTSAKDGLCEMIELPGHPWFVACQFHPEFTSTPRNGHPLFKAFIQAALAHGRPAEAAVTEAGRLKNIA